MSRCALGIFFLLLGCAQSNKISSKERAMLHLQMGSSHLAQGNLPGAMAEFSTAEQLDSSNAAIQNNIGLVLQLRGRPKEAEQRFTRALKLDPKYTDVRTNLARLYIDTNRIPEALQQLRVVENDLTYPAPEKVLTLSGMAQFKNGQYQEAEEKLSRALQVERTSCLAANFLGRAYYQQKKMEAASQVLDQAVSNCRGTQFEEPLFFSAMAHYSVGKKNESRARVEELLQKYPNGEFSGKARAMLKILE